ncbi:DUF6681 family protein [Pediococcus damnosus]|uniref:DUF6681 family protein n=2 Tax=Pediococcus damnosus TaxID=51663 RepID=UPI00061E9B89|nr:DUF6681 family protein [Pediococcus damnosus]AMV68850.1 Hypothetical protein ADU73_0442 [Pediococcus damnosus]KJU74363.1 membrane protein [Pediococcus damnosus LMG 28219]PIO85788.1 hypothetical protein BSQ37_07485 [Pediococcus damnosus]PJE49847.1 DUF2975 domain-containing protein [Pediococcus damnosus]GEA94004.1 hypothetical protein PDA01_18970 [Pediococcus damnosus]
MFSIIDMINHYLGYININLKLKNRIYTVIGFIGNFYMLYLAYRFFENGRWVRGLGFIAVFLIFLYFLIMNIYYYFTTKKAPFDISPKIEKLLGGKPREAEENERLRSRGNRGRQSVVPSTGIFEKNSILPATIKSNQRETHNIQVLADQMIRNNFVVADYSGLSDDEILDHLQSSNETEMNAIGEGMPFPYFELREENSEANIYAGMNQMNLMRIGRVASVGLSDYFSAKKQYELYLAQAVLIGGPRKFAGRSSLMSEEAPYEAKIQMAYKKREDEATQTRRRTY